jgi:hypothetical protein
VVDERAFHSVRKPVADIARFLYIVAKTGYALEK